MLPRDSSRRRPENPESSSLARYFLDWRSFLAWYREELVAAPLRELLPVYDNRAIETPAEAAFRTRMSDLHRVGRCWQAAGCSAFVFVIRFIRFPLCSFESD